MADRNHSNGDAFLRFWGVRGSYAAPYPSHMKVGGNTSCMEIRSGNHLLLCDAGTGIIPLGNMLMKQRQIRELFIILTHYHWDHICGLPFFTPAFSPEWKITIFGPGESNDDVKEAVSSQMRTPFFPVSTETWLANIRYRTFDSSQFSYGPMNVHYQGVHHPGTTYGYRVEVGGRHVTYTPDNECMVMEKTVIQKSRNLDDREKTFYGMMQQEEYESDRELFKDADILVHDAQYTMDEYEKKQGWGHSCYLDTVQSAIDAKVKVLFLFHHDPAHDDRIMEDILKDAEMMIKMHGAKMKCYVAREGMRIRLPPKR